MCSAKFPLRAIFSFSSSIIPALKFKYKSTHLRNMDAWATSVWGIATQPITKKMRSFACSQVFISLNRPSVWKYQFYYNCGPCMEVGLMALLGYTAGTLELKLQLPKSIRLAGNIQHVHNWESRRCDEITSRIKIAHFKLRVSKVSVALITFENFLCPFPQLWISATHIDTHVYT